MHRSIVAAALILSAQAGAAQTPPSPPPPPPPPAQPCRSPEARQFDFWLGTWELKGRSRARPGSDEWRETRSVNTIRKEHDGCVIQESFKSQAPASWTGMSVSVWDPVAGQWQQTWVDSHGSYIALTGEFKDRRMTLTTAPRTLPDGSSIRNRMVFYAITANSLQWDWDLSRDGGQTWEVMWTIGYRRRN